MNFMYIISEKKINDMKVFFGECLEDGFYYENEDYYNVSEKMEEHERRINGNKKIIKHNK